MMKQGLRMAVLLCGLAIAAVPAHAQEQAAPPPAAPPQGQAPARGGGAAGMKVGQTGNPDPGVNFVVVVENPHVRVLQVTLQPGAVRRPHVHNDVTFHMMVPVTGSLELTVEKDPVITTVPGQAYYMVKGQTHSFTNKSGAAVQVIELFIKPDPGAAPAAGTTTAPATTPPATAAPTAPEAPTPPAPAQ
jgi:quercetin dioxygenase-like cupin family protein